MNQRIAHIALIVRDYDKAIEFYTHKLDFTLIQDTHLTSQKRWVLVRPPGPEGCSLLLAKAADEQQARSIGKQAGGRVFLFLYTDDFWRDFFATSPPSKGLIVQIKTGYALNTIPSAQVLLLPLQIRHQRRKLLIRQGIRQTLRHHGILHFLPAHYLFRFNISNTPANIP